ncbi:hypothetical protein MTR67_043118 [Solanum verrucosum]|uniref:Integrase catalytic domain-containing protein n=1 Tax=Solanum verrucosum TaxID=315347 RepID=A0AAF0UN56_SOLVR|nr:hypothetical protein MTR67_043118 [Solanum verrucosum]
MEALPLVEGQISGLYGVLWGSIRHVASRGYPWVVIDGMSRYEVRLHGVSLSIITDRGTQFTAQFWKSFQKGLGSKVSLNTAFHPQTDGQAEHTIQPLEDMLTTFVLDFKGNWNDHLPLIEFAHNSNYHSSIRMVPSEALYR